MYDLKRILIFTTFTTGECLLSGSNKLVCFSYELKFINSIAGMQLRFAKSLA